MNLNEMEAALKSDETLSTTQCLSLISDLRRAIAALEKCTKDLGRSPYSDNPADPWTQNDMKKIFARTCLDSLSHYTKGGGEK